MACLDYPHADVIVVDNGSEDDSVAVCRARFPWARIIETGRNLGFCAGNNVGMRHALEAGYDYVLLLNSDTKFTPTLVRELVRVMEDDPRIGIAGAKNLLMENPGLTWGKYGKVTWGPLLTRTVGSYQLDEQRGEEPRDVDWVIGNACLMRRTTLEQVGLFDEEFWQCNEDVDWCYRARRAGWRIVYVDRAAILHKGGSSADVSYGKIFSYGYFIGRNAFFFARKYGTVGQRVRLTFAMLVGVIGRLGVFAGHNLVDAIRKERAFVRGMHDGMRGRFDEGQIEVRIRIPGWDLQPGPWQRFRKWVGA